MSTVISNYLSGYYFVVFVIVIDSFNRDFRRKPSIFSVKVDESDEGN